MVAMRRQRIGKGCLLCLLLLMLISVHGFTQAVSLNDFSSLENWDIHHSEAVAVELSLEPGKAGECIRMDFDFIAGSGYGGINTIFTKPLPENFQFSFWLKAEAPTNNFEFKIIDESGENVSWLNQRNFDWPQEWQKVTIKKRHIEYAWGPDRSRALTAPGKLEFIVASSSGGKGTLWLDELTFEALSPPDSVIPQPMVQASSEMTKQNAIEMIVDDDPATFWQSSPEDQQSIVLDFGRICKYGGLVIDWIGGDFARQYSVDISNDGMNWEPVYSVTRGAGGRSHIAIPEGESQLIRLNFEESGQERGYAIGNVAVRDLSFSASGNAFFTEVAAHSPRGYFPRYLYGEQSYWTVVGVNNDEKEALVGEDGCVEVDKSDFSLSPFISLDGQLRTWDDGELTQELAGDYLPIPSVRWQVDSLELRTTVFADGDAGNSLLYVKYTLTNNASLMKSGNFYIALRPFQVNAPWQFLNWPGGTSEINSFEHNHGHVLVNERKIVYPLTGGYAFGATEFDEGDISTFLAEDQLPPRQSLIDHTGYASAAFQYPFQLPAGASKTISFAIPFYETDPSELDLEETGTVASRLASVKTFWESKINTIKFDLPPSADRIVNSIRSNLAYILINRDGPGIQPGSRSYERSWIRDGSMTSSALLKLGVQEEVREFLSWYAPYQFESGKVPCVVDRRGPDPVPEHDSHGQLIFGLYQYFLFTKDTSFLQQHFPYVVKAVDYMDYLIAQRSTEEYLSGDVELRARYGILPESISHEGYSAKPMHSFWDNFFALKGYKDAIQIAEILGESALADRFRESRNRFQENLYQSIQRSIAKENIDFIPGCVELGDFDATSTAIAIYPGNELRNLPQPYAQNTFDRYLDFFRERRQADFVWQNYTPYEVRLIGTFLYLDQPEQAHELIDFFMQYQRPATWNHWAEVVRKGYRTPGFIGDMPHTWVGSDFVNAARAMFVYEDELEDALVIGAGLYPEWLQKGMSVEGMPTYYGKISYSIKQRDQEYHISLKGDLTVPAGGIRIRHFEQGAPEKLVVNGKRLEAIDPAVLTVHDFPADISIRYDKSD